MFSAQANTKVISVTKLNRFAKQVLESEIGHVWVSGEISNFVRAASGHWYFTLKDERAQVRTAMFKGANRGVATQPKNGDKVIVKANISLYEPRGDYQLIAQHIEPEGLGQLKQAFEALKQRLQTEGLFLQETKQALPKVISTIGIVSSPTGAAIHDILHVLKRRNPAIRVIIYPTQVQGEGSAELIAEQIEKANLRKEVDVLIVGRGGGSLEDLWAFNEEVVARAIFHSSLPVVSAVGHEIDVSIADFVADIRAATPSAAAELLSYEAKEQTLNISRMRMSLLSAVTSKINQNIHNLTIKSNRLHIQTPQTGITQSHQKIDILQSRLVRQHPIKRLSSCKDRLNGLRNQLETHLNRKIDSQNSQCAYSFEKLMYVSPLAYIEAQRKVCSSQSQELINHINQHLEIKKAQLSHNVAMLNAVNPLEVLSRGYSITYSEGAIVKDIHDIGDKNTNLTTRLQNGTIESEIKRILKDTD